jgi:hypothetical protein
MPPTIRMMIDRTEAKIGRSMKKWEKRMICGASDGLIVFWAFGGGADLALLRHDLGARPHHRVGEPVEHHLSVAPGPRARRAGRRRAAQRHGLGLHDVVVADREHDLARLVGDDRRIGDQQRVVLAAEQLDAAEDAGRQQLVLVLDDGARADGAGARLSVLSTKSTLPVRVHSLSSASGCAPDSPNRATTPSRRTGTGACSAGSPIPRRRTRSGWDRA